MHIYVYIYIYMYIYTYIYMHIYICINCMLGWVPGPCNFRCTTLRTPAGLVPREALPCPGVQGAGFRVQGSGFRVQTSDFKVQGSGFRVQGAGFRVQGSGFRVQGAGCRVQGSGFRVPGSAALSCHISWAKSFNSSNSVGILSNLIGKELQFKKLWQ